MTGLTAAIAVALTAAAAPAATPADRLERKIQVMERVIDEVLVQSEHVAVSSQRATRGLALDGYGVLFTFEASLGGELRFNPGGPLLWSAEGGGVTPYRVGDDPAELVRDLKEQRAKAAAERDAHRAALQAELVDALLDYGATLNELAADDRVVVAAFLGFGFGFDGDRADEQLIVKARYGDLQRFLVGDLSRQEAAALIEVTRR